MGGEPAVAPDMSPELIAILAVGVALGGIAINGQRIQRQAERDIRREIAELRERMGRLEAELRESMGRLEAELRESMAKIEGLIEGLRESISGRRKDAAE